MDVSTRIHLTMKAAASAAAADTVFFGYQATNHPWELFLYCDRPHEEDALVWYQAALITGSKEEAEGIFLPPTCMLVVCDQAWMAVVWKRTQPAAGSKREALEEFLQTLLSSLSATGSSQRLVRDQVFLPKTTDVGLHERLRCAEALNDIADVVLSDDALGDVVPNIADRIRTTLGLDIVGIHHISLLDGQTTRRALSMSAAVEYSAHGVEFTEAEVGELKPLMSHLMRNPQIVVSYEDAPHPTLARSNSRPIIHCKFDTSAFVTKAVDRRSDSVCIVCGHASAPGRRFSDYELAFFEAAARLSEIAMQKQSLASGMQTAASQLDQSERRFRLLFEGSKLPSLLVSDHGEIMDINSAALELLGLEAKSHHRRTYHLSELPLPPTLASREGWGGYATGGQRQDWHGEGSLPALGTDGEGPFPSTVVSWSVSRIGPDLHHVSLQDITDRRERVRLQGHLARLERLEALGRVTGSLAHDLNNVLLAILGYSNIAQMQLPADSPIRADLDEVIAATNRGAGIIESVLTFGQRTVVDPRPFDINASLRSLSGMLRPLVPERIRLHLQLCEGALIVQADPGQIDQAVVNLVTNARDSISDHGTIELRTSVEIIDTDHHLVPRGEYAKLEVSDTGCGIDPAIRELIFEPFFSTKPKGKGTGLGLASVYGTLRQAGGTVLVDSQPGEGTRFTVYIPKVHVSESLEPTRDLVASGAMGGSETVLVAEDNDTVRSLTVRLLKRNGYEVLAAENGQSALDLARRFDGPIHVLLTDVIMPELQGHELARLLRKDRPDTRVIYMSGYSDTPLDQAKLTQQRARFISKPFSPNVLVSAVREVLDDLGT